MCRYMMIMVFADCWSCHRSGGAVEKSAHVPAETADVEIARGSGLDGGRDKSVNALEMERVVGQIPDSKGLGHI